VQLRAVAGVALRPMLRLVGSLFARANSVRNSSRCALRSDLWGYYYGRVSLNYAPCS
jgi:hypothetical protein